MATYTPQDGDGVIISNTKDTKVTLDSEVVHAVVDSGTVTTVSTVTAVTGITNAVTVNSHAVTNAGTFAVQAAAQPGVDIGDVDVTSVVPGVGATNLGKAEDGVHTSGDTGVMMLAVRRDAGTAISADGDYIPLITNSAGHLWTWLASTAIPALGLPGFVTMIGAKNGTTVYTALCDTSGHLDIVGKLSANSGVDIGDVDVTSLPALATGTNTIGNVGTVAIATGGATSVHLVSAGSGDATNVKAGAGKLLGWYVSNTNAAARYIKFHNTVSAPTPGSGVVMAFMIPAGGAANMGFGEGIDFATGIAFSLVTGAADADTTGVAASEMIVNLWYK